MAWRRGRFLDLAPEREFEERWDFGVEFRDTRGGIRGGGADPAGVGMILCGRARSCAPLVEAK